MKLLFSILFSLFSFNSLLFCQGGFEEPEVLFFSENDLIINARYFLDDFNDDGNIDIFGYYGRIYLTDENLEVQDTVLIHEFATSPMNTFDFTGNGLKDLFYFIEWYEALEDGTYIQHSTFPNGMYQPADFDNDGRTDILIRQIYTTQQNWIEIGWNNGMSDYENDAFDFNTYTSSFVKDFNGDDYSDFATLHDSSLVKIYLNQQDSTFNIDTLNLQVDVNDERKYTTIKHGDIDNDGIGDIISIGKGNYLCWLKGLGNGDFGEIQHYYLGNTVSDAAEIKGFAVRDFNFDWKKDIAVIVKNGDLAEVYLIWNSENGLMAEPEKICSEFYPYFLPIRENNIILDKDIDGDGRTDIVIHLHNKLIWMKNNHVQTSTENIKPINLKISPNPFLTHFTINSDSILEEEILTMKVSNSTGETILEREISLPYSTNELENMPKGVYFISLSNKENDRILVTKKIVKF